MSGIALHMLVGVLTGVVWELVVVQWRLALRGGWLKSAVGVAASVIDWTHATGRK